MEDKILNFFNVFFVVGLILFNPILSKDVVESSEECPLQMRSACRCGKAVYNDVNVDKTVFVVNCSYVNLSNVNLTKVGDNVSFLHYLPQETEVLLLNNNNLTVLPSDFLVKPENYKNLKAIDLSSNNLITIHNETFKNLTQLRILNLNDNQIQLTGDNYYSKLFLGLDSLENLQLKNSFGEKHLDLNFMEVLDNVLKDSKLVNLKVLNLAENHIRIFNSPFIFCSLPALEKLYLSHNLLSDQIELSLNCTPKLFILDLSNNYITKVTNQTIENYDESKLTFHLNLTNNPWNCDCQLIAFVNWTQITKVWIVGLNQLQCESGPGTNVGKYIQNLTLNDLPCKDTSMEEQAYHQHLVITYSIIISLIASLLILLTAVLLVSRKSLAYYWQEISNSIAKKRDYAPLEKHNNQTVINQQTDEDQEDQFEEAQQQHKDTADLQPTTEIVEDVV